MRVAFRHKGSLKQTLPDGSACLCPCQVKGKVTLRLVSNVRLQFQCLFYPDYALRLDSRAERILRVAILEVVNNEMVSGVFSLGAALLLAALDLSPAY